MMASSRGDNDEMVQLLKNNQGTDTNDAFVNSLLAFLVRHNCALAAVKCVINEIKARDTISPDDKTKQFNEALISAQSVEVAEALLDAGADVNYQNSDDQAPCMSAAMSDTPELIRFYLTRQANIEAKNKEGKTALMFAAEIGDPSVVQALLDAGANINATSNDGKTVLMHSACRCESAAILSLATNYTARASADICRLLIAHGADVNANNNGATALYLAVESEHPEATRILLEHGADVTAVCADNQTPLSLAQQNSTRKADDQSKLAECAKLVLAQYKKDIQALTVKTFETSHFYSTQSPAFKEVWEHAKKLTERDPNQGSVSLRTNDYLNVGEQKGLQLKQRLLDFARQNTKTNLVEFLSEDIAANTYRHAGRAYSLFENRGIHLPFRATKLKRLARNIC